MSFIHKFRAWCWRWHQRIGMFSALLLVVIATTGIMLNHTGDLALDKRQVGQNWLLSWYGLARQTQTAVQLPSGIISRQQGTLLLNGDYLSHCKGEHAAAAPTLFGDVVMCQDQLLILDFEGHILDIIKTDFGLPTPVSNISQCQGNVVELKVRQQMILFDVENLSEVSTNLECATASYPAIEFHTVSDGGLSWQKVVQDIHSGRFFGPVGVWIYDIATLALVFLALSGFWLWYNRNSRSRK